MRLVLPQYIMPDEEFDIVYPEVETERKWKEVESEIAVNIRIIARMTHDSSSRNRMGYSFGDCSRSVHE